MEDTKDTQHKKKLPGGAVAVSRRLQLFVIVTAAVAVLFQIISLLPYYVTNQASYRVDFAVGVVTTTVYPVLIFAAAYYLSPRYKATLQRIFIAAIKTAAVTTIVSVLSTFKNISPVLFPWAFSGNGLAPSWITSFTVDYIFIALALATVIVFSLKHYKKR